MKRTLPQFALLLVLSFCAAQALAAPRTMRLDYYHTGNASREIFSVDRVVLEPLPWPGNPSRPLDDTNLGKYFFEVRDRASGRTLYSRGFSSVYGEWETTDEARHMDRTFGESLRFPAPDAPVQVVLKKRDANNVLREVWTTVVDPKDMFIDTSSPASPGALIEIQKNGDSAYKVDLLILGDGYTAAQRGKCEQDARRLSAILFAASPFKERQSDFNVWGLCPAAMEAGISRPSTGVHRRSPVGATYDAFGTERYVLTFDNRGFRDVAQFAPYEFVEIMANNETYGGGGIFNLYSTVAADSEWAPYVFVHEFGHHFGALADEYFTSPVAYLPATTRVEPWEPNVTALLDPKLLKWRELVSADTPLPTPWDEQAFIDYVREIQKRRQQIRKENRPEKDMNALSLEEKKHVDRLLGSQAYAGKVGAFEGANYEAKGYFRPEINCIMFTRHDQFCRVCQRGLARIIDLYSRP
jgi:IgA Peptidase M64/Peptidase M64 N-terminus